MEIPPTVMPVKVAMPLTAAVWVMTPSEAPELMVNVMVLPADDTILS